MNPAVPDIQMVKLSEIAPESSVNVRRQGVEESVETLVESMKAQGYLPEFPILLRPHPDRGALDFLYEHVEGQCRILAAGKVGFKEIPALIEELSDNEALRRSWNENEKRTNLAPSDRAYWLEWKYRDFLTKYQTQGEARRQTAKFFSASEATIRTYLAISVLPDSVQEAMDVGAITQPAARAIAKTHDSKDPEGSKSAMEVKADWFKGIDNADRKVAVEALNSKQVAATVEELDDELAQRKSEATSEIRIRIPTNMRGPLEAYGESQGIASFPDIVNNALMRTLRGEKLL